MSSKIEYTIFDPDELKSLIKESVSDLFNERIAELNPTKPEEELLSRKEVAKFYKTSLVTLRQWEKDAIIPKPLRKGSRVYFRKSDIMSDIRTKNRQY